MDEILFQKYRKPAKKKARRTERGDLFDQILSRLNPARRTAGYKPMGHSRLAYLLQSIPTPDRYALISKCNHAERRGLPWSAIFHKEITPPPPQNDL